MLSKVFILNGKGAVGKDEFKNFVIEYDKELNNTDRIVSTSIIDRVKDIAAKCGWGGAKQDSDRAFLHDLKILLEKYNDLPYKTVANFIYYMSSRTINGTLIYPYIFVDAREVHDIERLVKDFNATTVLVKRGDRVYGNEADDNVFNWQYDYVIDNNGTLNDLKDAARTFWNEITRSERIEKALRWENFEVENLTLKGEANE